MNSGRRFVIGDIHGCLAEVDRLIEHIAPTVHDTIIFLGDYVDRGPDSKGVVDRMVKLANEGPHCVFLKGNHEDMFRAYLGLGGTYGDVFIANGGGPTLRSYGIEGRAGSAALERMPESHRLFLESLVLSYEIRPFVCVHAGFAPQRDLDDQREEDMLWVRDEWVRAPHRFDRTVLFGHTPRREVYRHLPYKIGLDTGCVYWNKLSCLELVSGTLLQIQRGSRSVTGADLRRVVIQEGSVWPQII
jgi:serine/threonine protein phosphatase 1